MGRFRLYLAMVVFLGAAGASASTNAQPGTPTANIGEKVPGAERLEGRLLAPCCWSQTLDIHGSEIANSLRHEIRTRLKSGEAADAIEASLVARYGERIRAVPDRVPLDKMGGLGWLCVALAAGFVGGVLWHWRRQGVAFDASFHSRGPSSANRKPESSEASDERLDSELHRLDDT
jgi:cytochrome c-type biogenesis protein CcmH